MTFQEEFLSMNNALQTFVVDFAEGAKETSKVIRDGFEAFSITIKDGNDRAVTSIQSHVSSTVAAAQSSIQDAITRGVDVTTKNIQIASTASIAANNTESVCNAVLDSLSFEGMHDRHLRLEDVLESAHERTFSWVFQRDENVRVEKRGNSPPWSSILTWLKSGDRVYWVNGKPGSGKSTFLHFLATQGETKQALDEWKSGAWILSHYFWKPGTSMQNGIRGFWQSIIYQILRRHSDALTHVATTFGGVQDALYRSQWSIPSLRKLFSLLLQVFEIPVCIFMDGLDEVCDQNRNAAVAIISLIKQLQVLPNLKLCVSSRPEPGLANYLKAFPSLRMQDLTYADMRDFAKQELDCLWVESTNDSATREKTVESIVDKADGVFLWLRLALITLQSTIGSKFCASAAESLILGLPPELEDLYADMWRRRNGTVSIHRASAAKYLNLLLEESRIVCPICPSRKFAEGQSSAPCRHEPHYTRAAVGTVALARNPDLQRSFFPVLDEATFIHFIKICIETISEIEFQCAGLLSVLPHTGRNGEPQHERRVVCFMHRTAFDFITDTEQGQRILSFDTTSDSNRLFDYARGQLGFAKAIPELNQVDMLLDALANAHDVCFQMQISELLSNYCLLGRRGMPHDMQHVDALAIIGAVDDERFRTFLVAWLEGLQGQTSLLSGILASIYCPPKPPFFDQTSRHISPFSCDARLTADIVLGGGADPNATSPRAYHHAFRHSTVPNFVILLMRILQTPIILSKHIHDHLQKLLRMELTLCERSVVLVFLTGDFETAAPGPIEIAAIKIYSDSKLKPLFTALHKSLQDRGGIYIIVDVSNALLVRIVCSQLRIAAEEGHCDWQQPVMFHQAFHVKPYIFPANKSSRFYPFRYSGCDSFFELNSAWNDEGPNSDVTRMKDTDVKSLEQLFEDWIGFLGGEMQIPAEFYGRVAAMVDQLKIQSPESVPSEEPASVVTPAP